MHLTSVKIIVAAFNNRVHLLCIVGACTSKSRLTHSIPVPTFSSSRSFFSCSSPLLPPLPVVMLLTLQLCLAGLAGTSSHLGYFIQGEHHIQAPNIFRLYLVLTCLVFFVEAYCERQDVQTTVLMATSVVSCYSIGLFSSLLIYRVFFHRLHRFPGPRLAKVSKLWNVVKASKSTNFRLMEDLHDRYGDFVRTGTKKSLWLPIYYPAVYMLTLVQIRSK